MTLGATYARKGMTLALNAQRIGGGRYNSVLQAQNGQTKGVWYVNAAIEQRIAAGFGDLAVYANIDNIFDQELPFAFENQLGNYDRIGRRFRVGVRVTL